MRECLIIGKPNAGKTLFFLNFAQYLGLRHLWLAAGGPSLPLDRARRELVDDRPHRTLDLNRVVVRVPAGKGRKSTVLTDTAGLGDDINADPAIRQAMARTLRAIREAELILHLVDVAALPGSVSAPGPVDREVAAFARHRGGYAVLANKMDLPEARDGLSRLGEVIPGEPVIPISARLGTGFPRVRAFVRRWL